MSFNRYAYSNNNPYKYIDPNGKSPTAAGAAAGCALTGAGCPVGAVVGAIIGTAIGAGIVTVLNNESDTQGDSTSSQDNDKTGITIHPDKVDHIFTDKHNLEDTPENRSLLEDLASDPDTTLGPDSSGNIWSARDLSDGTQVWTSHRPEDGTIRNGGVNESPRSYSPETGLSAENKPEQK